MCKRTNVTYEVQCVPCKRLEKSTIYVGESHRSWWDRLQEHIGALRTKDRSYATIKHMEEHHGLDVAPDFSFKLRKVHKSSLERQLQEALAIAYTEADIVMNKNGEWGVKMVHTMTTTVLGNLGDWRDSPNQGIYLESFKIT